MFLIRLIHLSGFKPKNESGQEDLIRKNEEDNEQKNISTQIPIKETINQIKNVAQEKKINPQTEIETKSINEISIKSFNELVNVCILKKEMKLKYELEKNVNLVKFDNYRIEISFNDNLDKDFVKDLSTKLHEWTNQRWIISFSKRIGDLSIKDKEKKQQIELIKDAKKSDLYKNMLNHFSDAELIDVKPIKKDGE